jgi:hypothetical protein
LLRSDVCAHLAVFDVRLSESKLQYLATAAGEAPQHLPDAALHARFDHGHAASTGADARRFLERLYYEMMALIQAHCGPVVLPEPFRRWRADPRRREELFE